MVIKKMNISKEEIYEMYQKGMSVSDLSDNIGKSKSTIYRYINEAQDKIRYPQLRKEIRDVLLTGDFEEYIRNLEYSDVCILRRKFNLYGYDKKSKINSILKYFKSYSILGIYPENINRDIVKKAYFKMAKRTHPDSTKNKDSTQFKEVNVAYQNLMKQVTI